MFCAFVVLYCIELHGTDNTVLFCVLFRCMVMCSTALYCIALLTVALYFVCVLWSIVWYPTVISMSHCYCKYRYASASYVWFIVLCNCAMLCCAVRCCTCIVGYHVSRFDVS